MLLPNLSSEAKKNYLHQTLPLPHNIAMVILTCFTYLQSSPNNSSKVSKKDITSLGGFIILAMKFQGFNHHTNILICILSAFGFLLLLGTFEFKMKLQVPLQKARICCYGSLNKKKRTKKKTIAQIGTQQKD
jgi:hypothetical protein